MNYVDLKEIRQHGDEMMPICCYEINPLSGLRYLSCHWHSEMEIFKVVSGRMKIQCGESFIFAEPGSLFLFGSGQIHAAEPVGDEMIVYRAVVFSPEFLCGGDVIRSKYITPILNGRMKLPPTLDFDPAIVAGFDRLYDVLENREFGYELAAKAELLGVFARAVRHCEMSEIPASSTPAESVKSAISYIHEHYQRPITIEEMAALCGMSQGHFCRLFKQYTLKTPVQYINNVRVSKAIELLISGNRKVLDIAMETGFNGLSYFIGVFKESVGSTPTKFRKEYAARSAGPRG